MCFVVVNRFIVINFYCQTSKIFLVIAELNRNRNDENASLMYTTFGFKLSVELEFGI